MPSRMRLAIIQDDDHHHPRIAKEAQGFSGRTIKKLPMLAHALFVQATEVDLHACVATVPHSARQPANPLRAPSSNPPRQPLYPSSCTATSRRCGGRPYARSKSEHIYSRNTCLTPWSRELMVIREPCITDAAILLLL